jgi:hypothetical protein
MRQYDDAGQSVEDRHCTHAELEVSQIMPRAVQALFEVQAFLQILRMQCWLLEPQLLSTRHSMQTLFAVSQILDAQSGLLLQVATATHLLPLQVCPVAQSEFAVHWTHTPRVVSQTGSLEQSLLLLHAVKVTQRLPRQCPPDGQSPVFVH